MGKDGFRVPRLQDKIGIQRIGRKTIDSFRNPAKRFFFDILLEIIVRDVVLESLPPCDIATVFIDQSIQAVNIIHNLYTHYIKLGGQNQEIERCYLPKALGKNNY